MAHNARCARAQGRTCRCTGCGGSLHGWPGFLDLSRPHKSDERAARRESARLDWCTQVGPDEQTRCANLSRPTPDMLGSAMEMARVDVAEYLARHPLTVERVQQLGGEVSGKAFADIRSAARQQASRHPDMSRIAAVLPGHFWCSLLAALVGIADRIDRVDRKVPEQAKGLIEEEPPPEWGEAQELIADTALEMVWECAAGFLTWWRPDELLLAMRLLAVFICPAPVRHPDMARLCLSPQGKFLLTQETAGLLQQSVPSGASA